MFLSISFSNSDVKVVSDKRPLGLLADNVSSLVDYYLDNHHEPIGERSIEREFIALAVEIEFTKGSVNIITDPFSLTKRKIEHITQILLGGISTDCNSFCEYMELNDDSTDKESDIIEFTVSINKAIERKVGKAEFLKYTDDKLSANYCRGIYFGLQQEIDTLILSIESSKANPRKTNIEHNSFASSVKCHIMYPSGHFLEHLTYSLFLQISKYTEDMPEEATDEIMNITMMTSTVLAIADRFSDKTELLSLNEINTIFDNHLRGNRHYDKNSICLFVYELLSAGPESYLMMSTNKHNVDGNTYVDIITEALSRKYSAN